MCANLARCCSASSGIRMVAAICELSDNTNCDIWTKLQQFVGRFMEDFTKSQNWQNLGMGTCTEVGACLGAVQFKSQFLPLTTDDAFWCHQFWAKCYQLAQSVLKIGAESVKQGEVGGCTALAYSAQQRLQLPVEKPWMMLGGPQEVKGCFFHFAQALNQKIQTIGLLLFISYAKHVAQFFMSH